MLRRMSHSANNRAVEAAEMLQAAQELDPDTPEGQAALAEAEAALHDAVRTEMELTRKAYVRGPQCTNPCVQCALLTFELP